MGKCRDDGWVPCGCHPETCTHFGRRVYRENKIEINKTEIMSENAMDAKIKKLFDKVQEKKEEIKKAEKPNWKTNSSFGFDSSSKRTNLQVVGDVGTLVGILSFLYEKAGNFEKASKILGVDAKFEWMGFPLSDWEEDLKTRVNKIQITKKKAELETIESTLDRLISPERRREMELEAIEKLLED